MGVWTGRIRERFRIEKFLAITRVSPSMRVGTQRCWINIMVGQIARLSDILTSVSREPPSELLPKQHTASWYSSVELTARVREGKKVANAANTEIFIVTNGRTNLFKN